MPINYLFKRNAERLTSYIVFLVCGLLVMCLCCVFIIAINNHEPTHIISDLRLNNIMLNGGLVLAVIALFRVVNEPFFLLIVEIANFLSFMFLTYRIKNKQKLFTAIKARSLTNATRLLRKTNDPKFEKLIELIKTGTPSQANDAMRAVDVLVYIRRCRIINKEYQILFDKFFAKNQLTTLANQG